MYYDVSKNMTSKNAIDNEIILGRKEYRYAFKSCLEELR